MNVSLTVLAVSFILCANASAQDSLKRVYPPDITVETAVIAQSQDSLPFSVSVRAIDPLTSATTISLEQTVQSIPGLQIDNRNNIALGDRISIRGMGARSQFGVRGIRVIYDGTPLTFADGQTGLEILDPVQVRSVEVLRGPASALYGNASGGAVIFNSLPFISGRSNSASFTIGPWGYQHMNLEAAGSSGPLGYKASTSSIESKGYRDMSEANVSHASARFQYGFTSDTLRVLYDRVGYNAQNPGALNDSMMRFHRRGVSASNLNNRTREAGRQWQAGINWLTGFADHALNSTVYYVSRMIDNPIPGQVILLDRSLIGVRSILRSPELAGFSWALSGDFQYQNDERTEYGNVLGERGALQLLQDEKILNIGAGLQAVYKLSDQLRVLGGVRFDQLGFTADDNFIDSTNGDDSGQRTMSAFSPSIGLAWNPSQWIAPFANISTSFESPTTTELANQPDGSGGFNNELAPQRTLSFEAGFRGEISDLGWYSVAAFQSRIQDAFIAYSVPNIEDRSFYRNAGVIENKGLELEFLARPFEGMNLTLAYTFIESRFKDYIVGTSNFSGNRQPGVSPHHAFLGLQYVHSSGVYATANAKFSSKVAVNDANTFFSDEYTTLDLRAGAIISLAVGDEHSLALEPYVQIYNTFDRRYNSAFTINAFGNRYFEPAPERAIYAGIRVTY